MLLKSVEVDMEVVDKVFWSWWKWWEGGGVWLGLKLLDAFKEV